MPKKLSEEEYYRTLPKKQIGSGVLLFNSAQELLIVKPDYRAEWLVPGGTVDTDESPLACALRETREEIGLDISNLTLVGVHFGHRDGIRGDTLKFIFNGGVLTEAQIAAIRLQAGEIDAYRFLPLDQALPLLSNSLQACIPACIAASAEGSTAYIEGIVSPTVDSTGMNG